MSSFIIFTGNSGTRAIWIGSFPTLRYSNEQRQMSAISIMNTKTTWNPFPETLPRGLRMVKPTKGNLPLVLCKWNFANLRMLPKVWGSQPLSSFKNCTILSWSIQLKKKQIWIHRDNCISRSTGVSCFVQTSQTEKKVWIDRNEHRGVVGEHLAGTNSNFDLNEFGQSVTHLFKAFG